MIRTIVLGSRGSSLALWQANYVKTQLEHLGYQTKLEIITTKGDKIQNVSFNKIEGKGFFTKEIEDALLTQKIDLAIHSFKDMPTTSPKGLVLAGNSYRENPADWLFINKTRFDKNQKWGIKTGAKIGTSSPRRATQLLAHRPDLQIVPIRGNVQTRLRKANTEVDAVVLAAAGIVRLELDTSDFIKVELSETEFVPAPAQGVLAYQCRNNDEFILQAVSKISDSQTKVTNDIERQILQKLEGGCQQPIGIYSIKKEDEFHTWCFHQNTFDVDNPKPDTFKRIFISSRQPQSIVNNTIETIKNYKPKSVFISRDLAEDSYFKKYNISVGNKVFDQSLINFSSVNFEWDGNCDWLFFSSKNAVNYFFDKITELPAHVKVAAIGKATAQAIANKGFKTNFIGNNNNVKQIALDFKGLANGATVAFPQAKSSLQSIQNELKNNITVKNIICYSNEPKQDLSVPEVDILVFTSPLNVNAYFKKFQPNKNQTIVAIGNTTAKALGNYGLTNVRVAYEPTEMALADCCW